MRDIDLSTPVNTPAFGAAYLQSRITAEFALARHIGVVVERADDAGIILRAPLEPNANYKGTAFGGSLFSVAVLAGWAWVTRYLAGANVAADAVIQESTIRYLAPVHGSLRACAVPPADRHVDKLVKMLDRAGRGRIEVHVDVYHEAILATQFDGVFVAVTR